MEATRSLLATETKIGERVGNGKNYREQWEHRHMLGCILNQKVLRERYRMESLMRRKRLTNIRENTKEKLALLHTDQKPLQNQQPKMK